MSKYLAVQSLVYQYLSSFGVMAFRNEALQDAEMPFLIYDLTVPDNFEQSTLALRLYDKAEKGYGTITEVVTKLEESLPTVLLTEKGNVTLYKGSPFVQDINESGVKGVYINLIIEADF